MGEQTIEPVHCPQDFFCDKLLLWRLLSFFFAALYTHSSLYSTTTYRLSKNKNNKKIYEMPQLQENWKKNQRRFARNIRR
jgi:hypothetical protein